MSCVYLDHVDDSFWGGQGGCLYENKLFIGVIKKNMDDN